MEANQSPPTKKPLSLNSAGQNVRNLRKMPTSFAKTAFIVINDSYKLDFTGKENDEQTKDGYHMMKLLSCYGFETYYLHNGSSIEFYTYFDHFLSETQGYFVLFYVGKGGRHEEDFIVFHDTSVNDSLLKQHIKDFKNPNSILSIISDACHTGSMLNLKDAINFPPNVYSIAAFNDEYEGDPWNEHIEKGGQGVFAYHFRKALAKNPKLTPKQMQSTIENDLKRHAQTLVLTSSTISLLDTELFY